MPPALVAFLIKTVLPYIVEEFVKDKIIPSSVGDLIEDFEDLKVALSNLKTYSAPEDFPKEKSNFGG